MLSFGNIVNSVTEPIRVGTPIYIDIVVKVSN